MQTKPIRLHNKQKLCYWKNRLIAQISVQRMVISDTELITIGYVELHDYITCLIRGHYEEIAFVLKRLERVPRKLQLVSQSNAPSLLMSFLGIRKES